MSFFVITRTFIEEQEVRDEVLAMSQESAKIFAIQPGLIRMQSLFAENETHLTTYMEWESQQHHLDCMHSSDFKEVTPRWTKFIEGGKIRFELETYGALA